jgi:membrane fusion protein, copper/silver efflux system
MSKMKTFLNILFVRLRFVLVFVVVGLLVGNWSRIMNLVDRYTRPRQGSDMVTGEFEWFCPMHPSVVRNDPNAKCPICGMPLSKRKKGEKAELPPGVLGRLQLSTTRIRQAGVATEEVGYKPLTREIRTVGLVEWDERRYTDLSARVAGRADELYVNFTGVRVKKGDPLYRLYSPDLVSTQEEYLLALKGLEGAKEAGAEAIGRARRLADAARERLRLWGISDAQLAELEQSKKAQTHLTIASTADGIVVTKNIHAGHQVNMGDDPYTLVDDAVMWMQAEVFERDLGLIREGLKVEIASEAIAGKAFEGTVSFIAPKVSAETRTVKVRVDVPNPDRALKAGMYVTAVLRVPLGRAQEVFYGCCESCPEVRSDVPGKCPKCEMQLVLKAKDAPKEEKPHDHKDHEAKKDRKIYVCDLHPEEVSDKPGECHKGSCAGMKLEERTLTADSKLIYVCPDHPDVVSDKPGTCPKDGKKLHYRIQSPGSRLAEKWQCPMHPEKTGPGKGPCPQCGTDLKHVRSEEVLAIPVSAVIDTGERKVVFVDKGHGTFDAVAVVLGPRAGDLVQVVKGLSAGERVVSAGTFLLDAEARLNPAAGVIYFGASGSEGKK